MTTLVVGGLMIAVLPGFVSAAHQDGDRAFVVDELIHVVADASASVRAKLDAIGALERLDVVSVVDMFEMQMLMNHLSQLSEMSTIIVSAANQALASMARNVKS